jgi:hypothetical protein
MLDAGCWMLDAFSSQARNYLHAHTVCMYIAVAWRRKDVKKTGGLAMLSISAAPITPLVGSLARGAVVKMRRGEGGKVTRRWNWHWHIGIGIGAHGKGEEEEGEGEIISPT